jgi:hypothetical protein
MNTAIQTDHLIHHFQRNRPEAAVLPARGLHGKKMGNHLLEDFGSMNDKVLYHGKMLQRLQNDIGRHGNSTGETGLSVDRHGTLAAMSSFAVVPEREAWIKMLVNVDEAPENLIPGRIRNLVSAKLRFSSLFRVPAENLYVCLQGLYLS